VQENSRFIPYLQVGAGGTSVEVLQRVEGENFNFNLDAGLGCRYFFTRSFSANAECRYQHISNADLSAHNIGINAVGPVVSISYFF
jgi:opacity protein-like surface antigen